MNKKKIEELYWDRQLNVKEVAKEVGISYWSLYGFMNRNKINRRLPCESNFIANRDKPNFKIIEKLTVGKEKLKIAGLMLYWAEGTFLGKTLDFTNSNSDMIKLFLRFLREIYGVSEERLRVYLYAYEGQDIGSILSYWEKTTGIPENQFTKPYIKKTSFNSKGRKLRYGVVHIRYNDKRLLQLINVWLREFIDNWAGTQVAKGGRLSKGSVLSKGRMEK